MSKADIMWSLSVCSILVLGFFAQHTGATPEDVRNLMQGASLGAILYFVVRAAYPDTKR